MSRVSIDTDMRETDNILDIPGVTYSRSGAATAFRADGTLAEFAPNVMRRTDAGVTIEGQRTNMLLNSAWTGGATVASWGNSAASADAASSILGGVRARSFVASASRPYLEQSFSFASGATYCLSVMVEDVSEGMNANQVVSVANGSFTGPYPPCEANPSGGATGSVRKGRLLYVVTNPGATVTAGVRFGLGVNGNVTGTARLSLPQVEQASTPSTPIITTGAAATRGADMLLLAGLVTTLAAPFSVVLDTSSIPIQTGLFPAYMTVSAGSAQNWISIYRSNEGFMAMTIRSGGVQTGSGQTTNPGTAPVKVAIAVDGLTVRWAVNGVLASAVKATIAPVGMDRLHPLGTPSGAPGGTVGRSTSLFPYALTDAKLMELTR